MSNLPLNYNVTGLSPSTKYQYTICGKGDNVSSYYCQNPPSYFTTTPSVTMVNASTFGVKCDNSTDDTSNLQTAINTTASNGEGLLLPSSSTCLVSSTLSLPSNTFIEGGGLASSVIKSSVTGNALVNTSSSSGESNVTLARFAVQGAYSGEPFGTGSGNSPGLRLNQVDKLIIDEFGISHASGPCMSLLGDTHETVENSSISLCGRDGVTNFETAAVSNIDVTQNTISDVGDDAIAVDVSRCGCPPPGGNLATGVSITNNTINGWPTSHGTAPYLGRGIALNGVGGNSANTVTYNSIDSTFSAGIMVSGCTSSWCGSGYASYPDTNLTVQNNNVVNAGQLSTVSNSGVGPQPYGIYIYNAAAPVNITSNTITNPLSGPVNNQGCTGGCNIQTGSSSPAAPPPPPPTTTTTTTAPPTTTTTTAPSGTAGFGQPLLANPTGYTSAPIFQDTFPGTTLNTSKWSTCMGGSNNTHWNYADKQNPVVNNGVTIPSGSVINTANPCNHTHPFLFPQAGFYIQAKMKVSDTSHGFFPAIWFPQDSGGAPEIDNFEGGFLKGTTPFNQVSHIDYGGCGGCFSHYKDTLYSGAGDLTQNWTTYGMELVTGATGHAYFYVNGKLALSYTGNVPANTGHPGLYNFVATPQHAPCSGSGNNGWHSCGVGTGSIDISEVQVYALP